MRKLTLLILSVCFIYSTFAGSLIYIPIENEAQAKQLLIDPTLNIHYFSNQFIIAEGALQSAPKTTLLLDQNAWNDTEYIYMLVRFDIGTEVQYFDDMESIAEILHRGDDHLVVKVSNLNHKHLYPAIHGGLMQIQQRTITMHKSSFTYNGETLPPIAMIWEMMDEVDTANLHANVQHLEDYGTRNAYSPEAVLAQNWIYDMYISFGLDVELHDFTMPSGPASDNVIATLTGTKYPDEYVVLGGHYDSYSSGSTAPGADDNATGTCGVIEAARIMSQYEFDRSIIFCAWGGEEYGLYGSEAWASEAANDGMNIVAYFNMDMAGYLNPGDDIHTDIIAPASAQDLVDFYMDVCAVYLPDFGVFEGALSGGDSDHTSFNNNGYTGIFPFEDDNNYSPYIHTSNDIVGLSVNSFEMHGIFTQAIIANTATMANRLPTPEIVGKADDQMVELSWEALMDVDHYNIYKDGNLTPYDSTTDITYIDTDVENFTEYSYYVTAVFEISGDESGPSNLVTVVPMPAIALPFFDDYETGGLYWTYDDTWGLKEGTYYSSSHSITESPEGDYDANMDASATLRSVNFSTATYANLSFWTRYDIEEDYDYMYLEVSVDGINWDMLDTYTSLISNWTELTYSLDDYIGESNVIIRFRFYSDVYIEEEGMFIDDFMIDTDAVGLAEPVPQLTVSSLKPNPAAHSSSLDFILPEACPVQISIIDLTGKTVLFITDQVMEAGSHRITVPLDELNRGTYFLRLIAGSHMAVRKLVVIR